MTSLSPTSQRNIDAIQLSVVQNASESSLFVKSLFFATGCCEPVRVDVEIRRGFLSACSLGDVAYKPWLSTPLPEQMWEAIDFLRCTTPVRHMPSRNPQQLDNGYCLFFVDQDAVTVPNGGYTHPRNDLVHSVIGDLHGIWRGNILVLRYGDQGFADIEPTEMELLTRVVTRTISDFLEAQTAGLLEVDS